MACRKWMVRSLVFLVTAGLAMGGVAYQRWTNPTVIRQQVLAQLEEALPGAHVCLEAAHLRLLGGISFSELRLQRRGEESSGDFAYVPSGTIYHDKEQLCRGKMAIRKIEWIKPTLHILRHRDGTWNLTSDVLSEPDLGIPIPTIELQQATLLVEDQQNCPNLPAVEIKDVHLTIVNDPILVLVIDGTGITDLLGPIHIRGTYGRKTKDLTLALEVPSFPVGGPLVERIAAYSVEAAAHVRQLTGTGKFQVELSYHPHSTDHWTYNLQAELTQGAFRHARLPLPLENIDLKVRYNDGQFTVEHFSASSGKARLRLQAKLHAPHADADLDGRVEIDHLALSKELFEALPENQRELRDLPADFGPEGAFSLKLDFQRRGGRWAKHGSVIPEDLRIICRKEWFRYPLEHVNGSIDLDFNPNRAHGLQDVIALKIQGYASGQLVTVQGEVRGKKPTGIDLLIRCRNLPLDDQLCRALPKDHQPLAYSFHPTGLADIEAHIFREQGNEERFNSYLVNFHDCSLRYDVFPYPVENASGVLEIQPDHWEFRDFHGSHKGGVFHTHGGSFQTTNGRGVAITVTGDKVVLDDEMKAALVHHPSLQTTWTKLRPAGRIAFVAEVHDFPHNKQPDLAVTVQPLGASMFADFFPYTITDVYGTIQYHQDKVDLLDLNGRHGYTRMAVKRGRVYIKPEGGFSVDLRDLTGNPVLPDSEFLAALPVALAAMCQNLQLKDPVSLLAKQMTMDISADPMAPPHFYWDGGIRLVDANVYVGVPLSHVTGQVWLEGEHQGKFGNVSGNLDLEGATLYRQPLRKIQSRLVVKAEEPEILQLPNLQVRLFDGDVVGSMRVDFGPTLSYDVNVHGAQIKLEQFARHNEFGPDAEMSGFTSAHLHLYGHGSGLAGMAGDGSIEVLSGKISRLPLLLDLLKVLNFRMPDKTAFEDMKVVYSIKGPRVTVSRLDLLGNAISLSGNGTVILKDDLSDLDLDFCAVPARVVQLLPPVIDEIPPRISKQLLNIKMHGQIGGKMEFSKQPVPLLLEPLKEVLKRMRGKEQ